MSIESSTTFSFNSRPTWKVAVIARVGAMIIRTLRSTVRISFHGDEEVRQWERQGKRYILAFWHRHLLLMRYAYRGDRLACLISQSKDGELIARTMERFDVISARGSSSRFGVAGMRTLIRLARENFDLSITPDGPRGPLRVVQKGVIMAAASSGLPIVPIALAASRGKSLGSWDRFLLPMPFSRVPIVYGDPLLVERRGDMEADLRELTERMLRAEEEAERLAGHEVDLQSFAIPETKEDERDA